MNTLRIPKVINFGKDALSEAEYPKNALVVTTAPPALSGKWLDRMGIEDYMLYDKVTPEPSIDDVNGVISEFKSKDPSVIIGLLAGGQLYGWFRCNLVIQHVIFDSHAVKPFTRKCRRCCCDN